MNLKYEESGGTFLSHMRGLLALFSIHEVCRSKNFRSVLYEDQCYNWKKTQMSINELINKRFFDEHSIHWQSSSYM